MVFLILLLGRRLSLDRGFKVILHLSATHKTTCDPAYLVRLGVINGSSIRHRKEGRRDRFMPVHPIPIGSASGQVDGST